MTQAPHDGHLVGPLAAAARDDLERRGLLHEHADHVRSSQTFALNLFAPLSPERVIAVLTVLGLDAVDADPPDFEYEDLEDRLAETTARSTHRTQVDVVLRGRGADDRRKVALIEVKLSETDFGHCTAFASPRNPDRDNCVSDGLFGASPDRCFQLNNVGGGHRGYLDRLGHLAVVPPRGASHAGGCYVRLGRNQPMRNLAIAQVMLDEGLADQVTYALCAPRGHRAIWRRFDEFRGLFALGGALGVTALPAEDVVKQHEQPGPMAERYGSVLTSEAALLHLGPDGRLLGVWLSGDGHLDGHYDPSTSPEATARGHATVEAAPWADRLATLPSRSPYVDWWETVPVEPGETAADVHARVARTHFT